MRFKSKSSEELEYPDKTKLLYVSCQALTPFFLTPFSSSLFIQLFGCLFYNLERLLHLSLMGPKTEYADSDNEFSV